jgi:hypothetical protein
LFSSTQALLRSTGQRRWPSPDPGGCPRVWIWGV